jgi:hypothetical protein
MRTAGLAIPLTGIDNFASNKRCGLPDIGQRRLEGNITVGSKE